MPSLRILALLGALAAILAFGATPAMALPSADAVAKLNAQRQAHGIPAGIRHNAEWSSWCAKHNAYQDLNGGILVHDEDPSKPGYSEEGRSAARSSVLSGGTSWAAANPWENAPIHLHQLLAPRLDEMGVDDSNGYTCATTLLSRNRPPAAAKTVFAYPGPNTTHRRSEVANEGPYTPGERVGIPASTETGPYIYVSLDGPAITPFSGARMAAASLTGPDGPVEIKTVDNFTSGLENYLPPGGQIIPVRALRSAATYTATVRMTVEGESYARTWSFRTFGKDARTTWKVEPAAGGLHASFSSLSPAPGRLRAERPATRQTVDRELRNGAPVALALPPGVWRFCLDQASAADFFAFSECRPASVTVAAPKPTLKLGKAVRRKRKKTLTVPIATDPALNGRPLAVSAQRFRRVCRRGKCRMRKHGRIVRKTVTAKAGLRTKVKRPARRGRVVVRVRSAAFTPVDVAVPAASAKRRYKR